MQHKGEMLQHRPLATYAGALSFMHAARDELGSRASLASVSMAQSRMHSLVSIWHAARVVFQPDGMSNGCSSDISSAIPTIICASRNPRY